MLRQKGGFAVTIKEKKEDLINMSVIFRFIDYGA